MNRGIMRAFLSRIWRRDVRPGDFWTDGQGRRHVITVDDLQSGEGFDI
jgi:hypothetical protein